MSIQRTAVTLSAAAALTALVACGDNDTSSDTSNGTEAGSEDSFITDIIFGTGSTSGVYYPFGGELATLYEEQIDEVSVNYVESGGSPENMGNIMQEEWQLGLAGSGTANLAVNGELPDLDGTAIDNMGWMGNLYPEAVHIVVREDSGIESVEDLEGATVAVGDAGAGTRVQSDMILSAYGLEEGDYDAEVTDFGASTEMLADGQIDASFFTVGTPVGSLQQLASQTDVSLLPIDEDIGAQLEEGGSVTSYDIPAETYDFLDEDVPTVAVFASLMGSTTQISEDLGYELTRVTFEHADDITVGAAQFVDLDEALMGIGDIPLHPGAERYFEEQGLDLP